MLQPSPSLSYTTLQPAGNKWAGKSSSEKRSRSPPRIYWNTSNLNSTLNLYFLILPTLRLLSILSFNLLTLSSTSYIWWVGIFKGPAGKWTWKSLLLCIIYSYSVISLASIKKKIEHIVHKRTAVHCSFSHRKVFTHKTLHLAVYWGLKSVVMEQHSQGRQASFWCY